jgi:hypothetical protein
LSVAALQASWALPMPPVAVRLAGAVGACVSVGTTGVVMSCWISAAASARR